MSSPSPYQCINCGHLGHCSETDADKVMTGYSCTRWKEVRPEVYAARLNIVNLFGKQGINAIVQKDLKEEED